MEFTSRFNIDDIVIFQPNLTNNSRSYAGSVMAKIVAVKFTESKVFYDLALADSNNEEGFYTVCPLRDVDSCCVSK